MDQEIEDDTLFEPSLFDDSQFSTSTPPYSNRLYSEIEAIAYLRNLPQPEEPFWTSAPILNRDQIKKLYRLAENLVEICRQENIPIWIDGGTLLGAIRHRGLIPWDDDIDFSMFKSDAKSFTQKAIPRLNEIGYGVIEWWYGGYRIFPLDGDPISDCDRTIENGCKYPFADLFWMQSDKFTSPDSLVYWNYRARCLWPSGLTRDDLWPLRNYEFGPSILPGPKNYENHLNSLYGDDWPHVIYQTRKDHKEGGGWRIMKIRVKLERFPALLP